MSGVREAAEVQTAYDALTALTFAGDYRDSTSPRERDAVQTVLNLLDTWRAS